MYKARQFLSKRAWLDLYYAYIYPYMTYCIEVWGCAPQTQLNCIFLLQKKIVRIMNFSYYLAHTNPLFLSMEVLPLRKIFFHRVGLVMYKYSNHLLPECIAQLYFKNDSIHEHNTRGCQLLRVKGVFKGGGVQTPPPPKFSDFFLKSEGKEIERKRKKGMLGRGGYLLTYFWG